jgi:hypothetical protein
MKRISVLFAALAMVVACAHTSDAGDGGDHTSDAGDGGEYYGLWEVDAGPRRIACPLVPPPPLRIMFGSPTPWGSVRARVDVSATGQVENVAVRRLTLQSGCGLAHDVPAMLGSCHYTPAELDGRTVAVRGVSLWISFRCDS